jgi:serine/threonine protein kinase
MRESAGPYRFLDRIGEDRLGSTHRARDTARGRTAIVRVIHPHLAGDPARRADLIDAAQSAAAVSHPAVAALFDIVEDDAGLALAHEHVDGRSLAATLGGTALNPRLATAIAIQIADGLAELHAAGITHGAVDSEHVVISTRGQAKLIDAGLIRWLSETPPDADDIGALGKLLSAMTGSHLPRAQWADDLRAIIERAKPGHARRYESVATMSAELRSVAAMLEARAEAAPPVTKPSSAKSIVMWLVLAAVLLGLGAWFLLQ